MSTAKPKTQAVTVQDLMPFAHWAASYPCEWALRGVHSSISKMCADLSDPLVSCMPCRGRAVVQEMRKRATP